MICLAKREAWSTLGGSSEIPKVKFGKIRSRQSLCSLMLVGFWGGEEVGRAPESALNEKCAGMGTCAHRCVGNGTTWGGEKPSLITLTTDTEEIHL